jgi:hypothetical protein
VTNSHIYGILQSKPRQWERVRIAKRTQQILSINEWGLARHVYKVNLNNLPPKPQLVRDVEAAAVLVPAAGND